jgi:Maltokinase N-terminal cap domain
MGRFHRAMLTPTKAEVIGEWAPTQPWGPAPSDAIDVIGSFRFDDPDGRVGMETHLVTSGATLLQVPLTYRDQPLDGPTDHLVAEMEHSELGTRWVYDGLGDPLFVTMLAAVSLTGQGEALGIVELKDRSYVAPSNVRIHGGGWTPKVAPVDGFSELSADGSKVVLANDRFELTVFRRPATGAAPAIGLTATWDGRDPVVLTEVRELARD